MQPAPAPEPVSAPSARFTLARSLLGTARVWVRHLLAFTVVGVIVDLPLVAMDLRGKQPTQLEVGAALLLFTVLWVLRVFGTAAVSLGVLQSLTGARPTVVSMLATPARHLWPIFAVAGAYSALVLLGFTIILPGLFLFAIGYVAIPAVMAEPDMGTEAALRRSFVLTQGHRLELLAGFAALFGVEKLASLGVGALANGGPLASSRPAGIALAVAVDALLCGLTSCSFAVAYLGLRAEKGMPPLRLRSLEREDD